MDWNRLDRFVRGDGTPEELADLRRWVESDPRLAALTDAMRTVGLTPPPAAWFRRLRWARRRHRLWGHVRGSGSQWDAYGALAKIRPELAGPQSAGPGVSLAFGGRRLSLPLRAAAAAIAAAAVLMAGQVLATRRSGVDAIGQPDREVVTGPGERAVLRLRDGSRVTLSPGSVIRIPAAFGPGDRREVQLEGEAAFTVHHDHLHPFVVNTPHGSLEDLGTEFVVSTYPETEGMLVAVREGRVGVRPATVGRDTIAANSRVPSPDTVTVLGPGDIGRLRPGVGLTVLRAQDVASFFASAEGTLVLDAITLRDAIPRLERWYGLRLRVRDGALLTRRISGRFRHEAAADAIGVIAIAIGARARWQQDQVDLESNAGGGDNP